MTSHKFEHFPFFQTLINIFRQQSSGLLHRLVFQDETDVSAHMLPPSRRLKKLAPSWRRSVQGQNVLWLLKATHLYTSRWSDWSHSLQSASQSNPILTGITSVSTGTHFLRHWKQRRHAPLKRQHKPTTIQGADTQNTAMCTIHPPHEGSHLTLVIRLHDFPRQNTRPRYIPTHTHTHTHTYETSSKVIVFVNMPTGFQCL